MPGDHSKCIVPGCANEVVRVYVHKTNETEFCVCAFHGQAIIRHGTDDQVRQYLFPEEPRDAR